jgi:hypothetical protein
MGHSMVEARAERRLAAILATDMVGYSRLIGGDEEGTLTALKEVRIDRCRKRHLHPPHATVAAKRNFPN